MRLFCPLCLQTLRCYSMLQCALSVMEFLRFIWANNHSRMRRTLFGFLPNRRLLSLNAHRLLLNDRVSSSQPFRALEHRSERRQRQLYRVVVPSRAPWLALGPSCQHCCLHRVGVEFNISGWALGTPIR